MKKLIFIFFIFVFISKMNSQNSDLYKKYEFEEFLKTKTADSGYSYIRTIYKKVNTDYEYYENRDDINIRVLLINHGSEKEVEIIPIDETNNYRNDIIRTLKIANTELIKNDGEKYITELNITYEFEPHIENWNWRKEIPKIRLFIHKYVRKKVIMN
jgi:hypothetical protein